MESEREVDMIADAVRGLLARCWPVEAAVERSADPAALAGCWRAMTAQGFAAIGTDPAAGGLRAGIAVARELGRAGCPVPFMPQVIARFLAADAAEEEDAPAAAVFGGFDGDAVAGSVRFADGCLTGAARCVEHIATAQRLLVLVDGGIALLPAGGDGIAIVETPGLAMPPLADIRFRDVPATFIPVAEDRLRDAAMIARLLLAARAEGAARRAFDMVVAYVQERTQFGQPLARFQSMQHKLADGLIALDAALLLIQSAAAGFDGGGGWHFRADAAIGFAAARLRSVSLETQHAFGAIGYAEEHEAPRHFRRVHADLSRMGGQRRARAQLAASLLSGDPRFWSAGADGPAEAFRRQIRAWLDAN